MTATILKSGAAPPAITVRKVGCADGYGEALVQSTVNGDYSFAVLRSVAGTWDQVAFGPNAISNVPGVPAAVLADLNGIVGPLPTPPSIVTTTSSTTPPTTTDYAAEAKSEASEACSILAAFDKSAYPAVQASRSQGGNGTADEIQGAPQAAATAFGHANGARLIANDHATGNANTAWDQFALVFATLDAAEGNSPGNGITSPTDHAHSASAYGDAGSVCEQTFGSIFPTLLG